MAEQATDTNATQNTAGTANAAGAQAAAAPTTTPAPAARPTFDELLQQGYQAEFDRRVQKAIDTARSKFTDPRVDQMQAQLDGYIRSEAVLRADVDPKFAKFVATEVGGTLKDGQTFEDALSAYLKDNAQFLRQKAPAQGWSQPMADSDAPRPDGVEAAFAKLNPNIKL